MAMGIQFDANGEESQAQSVSIFTLEIRTSLNADFKMPLLDELKDDVEYFEDDDPNYFRFLNSEDPDNGCRVS